MSNFYQALTDNDLTKTLTKFALNHKHRFFVGLICVLVVYVFLSLLSYNPADPAWSHYSNEMTVTTNIGGVGGAYLSDWLYTFFGFGAWFVLLWLALEAMNVYYGKKRIVLPLRLMAYGFLWVCGSVLLYGFGQSLESGGIVGHEFYMALFEQFGHWLGLILTGVLFLVVGWLLIDLQGTKQDTSRSRRSYNRYSDLEPMPIITPKENTIPKYRTANQGSLLNNFLQNSGLKEELLLAKEEATKQTNIANNQSDNETMQGATIQTAHIHHATINANTIHQTIIYDGGQSEKKTDILDESQVSPTLPPSHKEPFADVNFAAMTAAPPLQSDPLKSNNAAKETGASSVSWTPEEMEKLDEFKKSVEDVDKFYIDNEEKMIALYNEAKAVLESGTISFENDDDNNDNGNGGTDNNDNDNGADNGGIDTDDKEKEVPFDFHKDNKSDLANSATPAKPDILDDSAFVGKSLAMQTAAYRASLTPIPSLDLLDSKPVQKVGYDPEELQQLAELLEIKLKEFGINATVANVIQGPIVTSFEVELAAGIKASKVSGISQDLARSLSMASLRVVEVIPGKPYIGIEIPNRAKETVKLIELLQSPDYQSQNNQIAMAMGKDIGGNVIITDLAKAPHMLVAGTTGSGKSVLVNAMLLSMLLKYTPDELRLILIDPKMLELANYNDIPHLLTPVVTDMTEAASALSWCVGEMERRYQLMSLLRVRKISEFNNKIRQAERTGEPILDPLWRPDDSLSVTSAPQLKPLPLIVVVADEFADMMMQVGKQAEELITRLAQKSRAAGIHLMLATQRPSVDVVTGLIKANIPSRAALRVNTRVDSRTILDAGGAEDMLGHGDMLFLAPGKNEPIRVHGAYVTDDEVNRVTDAWRERGSPDYIDTVTSALNFPDDNAPRGGKGGLDELYDEALAFVLETKKTSISALQRNLSIGYNRAANIIESMQEQGVLSAPDNSGKRTLL